VIRKAKIIRYSEDKTIAICVDLETWEIISEYVSRNAKHIKKFNYIVGIILKRLRNTDVYDKEEINKKSKGVTAMKFFKGQSNDRIYCKEQTLKNKTFVVVTAELFENKKTQGINQKIKNIIEKVGSYEYEIIED
jgi:predicted transcriptional regulator